MCRVTFMALLNKTNEQSQLFWLWHGSSNTGSCHKVYWDSVAILSVWTSLSPNNLIYFELKNDVTSSPFSVYAVYICICT